MECLDTRGPATQVQEVGVPGRPPLGPTRDRLWVSKRPSDDPFPPTPPSPRKTSQRSGLTTPLHHTHRRTPLVDLGTDWWEDSRDPRRDSGESTVVREKQGSDPQHDPGGRRL